ncbi:flagellar FliL protein [Roseovarius nanhaiticus]|uniref:Flagellar protein FliL n=1 Tax=Roseovarius nanhaiticus TaxID=573024 RepID=A0A1N7HLC9_9RHOB|nr:flagellar basal body-associated FliL family protein [Roseovarius nanhaiticus]SEL27135.1 flagellar FliL protein [Roseovarius nanhaiticus]SIS25561.1 flagellar FliL protein [Roseovarius nanhaiticus]
MAVTKEDTGEAPVKRSKKPLIIGLVLALAGAGGGFYAVWSGLIMGAESLAASVPAETDAQASVEDLPDVEYVAIEPLVISLGNGATGKHLRFRAQLEVTPAYRTDVEHLMPRVVDVLNSYLRALELADLTDKAALVRLRGHMLRRAQIVVGEGRINDLLIMEFVLN